MIEAIRISFHALIIVASDHSFPSRNSRLRKYLHSKHANISFLSKNQPFHHFSRCYWSKILIIDFPSCFLFPVLLEPKQDRTGTGQDAGKQDCMMTGCQPYSDRPIINLDKRLIVWYQVQDWKSSRHYFHQCIINFYLDFSPWSFIFSQSSKLSYTSPAWKLIGHRWRYQWIRKPSLSWSLQHCLFIGSRLLQCSRNHHAPRSQPLQDVQNATFRTALLISVTSFYRKHISKENFRILRKKCIHSCAPRGSRLNSAILYSPIIYGPLF